MIGDPEALPHYYAVTPYRGDDYTVGFSLRFSDDTYLDATGWTGRMHIRVDPDDETVVRTLTTDNGRLQTGLFDDGTEHPEYLRLHLQPHDTEDLPGGFVGVFDIELTDLSGRRKTLVFGDFWLEGDTTRG